MVRAGSLPTKGKSSGSESGGSSPEAEWEDRRTATSATEMQIFAYLEIFWPRTGSLGQEHYALFLQHTLTLREVLKL